MDPPPPPPLGPSDSSADALLAHFESISMSGVDGFRANDLPSLAALVSGGVVSPPTSIQLRRDYGRGEAGRLQNRIKSLTVVNGILRSADGRVVLPVELFALAIVMAGLRVYASAPAKGQTGFLSDRAVSAVVEEVGRTFFVSFGGMSSPFGSLQPRHVVAALTVQVPVRDDSGGGGESSSGGGGGGSSSSPIYSGFEERLSVALMLRLLPPLWTAAQRDGLAPYFPIFPATWPSMRLPSAVEATEFISGWSGASLLIPYGDAGLEYLTLLGVLCGRRYVYERSSVRSDGGIVVVYCCMRSPSPVSRGASSPAVDDSASAFASMHADVGISHVGSAPDLRDTNSLPDGDNDDEDVDAPLASTDAAPDESDTDSSQGHGDTCAEGGGGSGTISSSGAVPSSAAAAALDGMNSKIKPTLPSIGLGCGAYVSVHLVKAPGSRMLVSLHGAHNHPTVDDVCHLGLPPEADAAVRSAILGGPPLRSKELEEFLRAVVERDAALARNLVLHHSQPEPPIPGIRGLPITLSRSTVNRGRLGVRVSSEVTRLMPTIHDAKQTYGSWCVCAAPQDPFHPSNFQTTMYECTSARCPFLWLHASCIRLTEKRPPEDISADAAWLCPHCAEIGVSPAPVETAPNIVPPAPPLRDSTPTSSPSDNSAVFVASSGMTHDAHLVAVTTGSLHLDNLASLSLPTAISASTFLVTTPRLTALISAAKRAARGQQLVTEDAVAVLLAHQKLGNALVQLTRDPHSRAVSTLWAAIVTPVTGSYLTSRVEGVSTVTVSDFTFSPSNTNQHIGVLVGFSPDAGGYPISLLHFVYLAGSGIEDEKTKAHEFFYAAVQHFGIPPSFVRLFDKDRVAFIASLRVNQRALQSEASTAALKSLVEHLEELSVGVTASHATCAARLCESLPSYMTGLDSIKSASSLPLTPASLRADFPDVWSGASAAVTPAHAFRESFKGPVVDKYGPIMPGIAAHVCATLQRTVSALCTATSYGQFNVIAANLLYVYDLAQRGGSLSAYLERFCLLFCLLCRFHQWQALERKAAMCLDREAALAALDGFRRVLDRTITFAEYKEKYAYLEQVMTHDSEGGEAVINDGAKTVAKRGALKAPKIPWFQYLERYWLCSEFRSTVDGPFRALLAKLNVNVTNDAENKFNALKNRYQGGKASPSFADALAAMIGEPGDEASMNRSMSGQHLHDLMNILAGSAPMPRRRARVSMESLVRALLQRERKSPTVRDDGNGWYTIGSSMGGFTFEPHVGPIPNMKELSAHERAMTPGAVQVSKLGAVAGDSGHDAGSARTALRVRDAVARARQVLVGKNPNVDVDAVEALCDALMLAHRTLLLSEFDVLRHMPRNKVRAILTMMHPSATTELALLLKSLDSLSAAEVNAKVHHALARGWVPLKLTDFRGETPPHVSLIYVIDVGMSAQHLVTEYDRVVVRGDRTSLAHGHAVSTTYISVLEDLHATASALVSSKHGSVHLHVTYIGKEQRGSKSKTLFYRVWEHGMASGNPDVRELLAFFGRGSAKVLYSPVGAVTFMRRVLVMLPGESVDVDFAEGVTLALLLLFRKGFHFFNMSPTGEVLRFLLENYRGDAPKVVGLCEVLIERCSRSDARGRMIKGADAAGVMTLDDAGAIMGPFTGRVLRAVHALLARGHYTRADGTPLPPCFPATSQFSLLTCINVLVLSRQAGNAPQTPHQVALWCNACDCDFSRELLCPHILALRLYHVLGLKRPVMWNDLEERMYAAFVKRESTMPQSISSAVVATAPAPQAPASVILAEADSVSAEVALLLAAAAENAVGGDASAIEAIASAVKSLSAVAEKLRKVVRISEDVKGASGRGRSHRASARDPAVIKAAEESAPRIYAPALTPLDLLQRSSSLLLRAGDAADAPSHAGGAGGSDAVGGRRSATTIAVYAHASLSASMSHLAQAEAEMLTGRAGGGGSGVAAGIQSTVAASDDSDQECNSDEARDIDDEESGAAGGGGGGGSSAQARAPTDALVVRGEAFAARARKNLKARPDIGDNRHATYVLRGTSAFMAVQAYSGDTISTVPPTLSAARDETGMNIIPILRSQQRSPHDAGDEGDSGGGGGGGGGSRDGFGDVGGRRGGGRGADDIKQNASRAGPSRGTARVVGDGSGRGDDEDTGKSTAIKRPRRRAASAPAPPSPSRPSLAKYLTTDGGERVSEEERQRRLVQAAEDAVVEASTAATLHDRNFISAARAAELNEAVEAAMEKHDDLAAAFHAAYG